MNYLTTFDKVFITIIATAFGVAGVMLLLSLIFGGGHWVVDP